MGRARSGSAASQVTAQITLREFEDADVDAATAWISDPAVTRFMTWDPGDRAQAAAWLRRVAADASALPRTSWELAVVEPETGLGVGAGRLTVRDAQHRCGDIGYVLRRDRWGREGWVPTGRTRGSSRRFSVPTTHLQRSAQCGRGGTGTGS